MNFDFNTYTKDYIDASIIKEYAAISAEVKKKFESKKRALKWYHMGEYVDNIELKDMITIAEELKGSTDVLLVIGIGGSSMGTKAVIEALKPYYRTDFPEIIFVGTTLSSRYYHDLLFYLKEKRVSINVISKSGSTTETLITYQVLMQMMKKRYSKKELRKRIFITTNIHDGTLLTHAKKYGFRTFFIPDEIPGGYSVLTPATLFPMAVAGIDIIEFLKGAKEGRMYLNYASIYAMIRTIFFRRERYCEVFTVYEPKLHDFTKWLQQLFSKSEGKDCKGILPLTSVNPGDLHSLGQFISEGNPILFETILKVEKTVPITIEKHGKLVQEIEELVLEVAQTYHMENGCPSNIISIEDLTAYHMGELCMFFMMSATFSACLIGVNPMTQQGIDQYKMKVDEKLKTEY